MRTPKDDLKALLDKTCWVIDIEDPKSATQLIDLGMLELVVMRYREGKATLYGYTLSNKKTGNTLMLSVNVDKKNLLNEITHTLEALGVPMETYK